jgi:RNA polymerase sigma-70 factor (ECF subfamily)
MIEAEIIERSMNGSLSDFRRLIETASPAAFSVAFRMVGDEEQARDIVQETMITIWESLNKIKSPEAFNTWLYRIVVNKCYDHLRKRKRNPELRADDKTWALIANRTLENPSAALENAESARVILLLTEKLSPKQKAVFVLSDLEEMTNEEVALVTGMSRMNVKANLHYARKRIGEMIEKYI